MYGRRHNYGCGPDNSEGIVLFESSTFYTLFCIIQVTYAGELLLWPCLILNQIVQAFLEESRERSVLDVWRFISQSPHSLKPVHDHQYRRTAKGIGDCLKCIQLISCNNVNAGDIQAEVDLSDAAISFMDFFNVESNFDIVLSDVYVAFKLLNRLRKTKAFELNHNIHIDKARQRASIISINRMIEPSKPDDMECIREAARYAPYAEGIYDDYRHSLQSAGKFSQDIPNTYLPDLGHDNELVLSNCFRLTEFDRPNTAMAYGSFINQRFGELIATPYCILIDNDVKKVIVVVRGSASLEDLVTDLQLSPESMHDIGQAFSFDGNNKYAHRGILTRAKWIVNDIKEKRVLRQILPPSEKDRESHQLNGYSLVFTGHSLGATCAAMLATMFKPMYNDAKCYAFCPPGCSGMLLERINDSDFSDTLLCSHYSFVMRHHP